MVKKLLLNAKQSAKDIMATCDLILDGKSEEYACKHMGINKSKFRRFLRCNYHKSNVQCENINMDEYIEYVMSPAEKLYCIITGNSMCKNINNPIPEHVNDTITELLNTYLTDDEKYIITSHFWDKMSLRQIAKTINVSVETVRKREEKIIKKLSQEPCVTIALYGKDAYVKQQEIMKSKTEIYKNLYSDSQNAEIKYLEKQLVTAQNNNDVNTLLKLRDEIDKMIASYDKKTQTLQLSHESQLKIVNEELSTRARNAIVRYNTFIDKGVHKNTTPLVYISDLNSIHKRELLSYRGIGKGILEEIEQVARKYGITLKE